MQRRTFLAGATAFAIATRTGAARADALLVNAPHDGYLNLRTGPGEGFDILFEMPHGSEVHTLEWAGDWVRVRHASGHTGWCAAKFLARSGPKRYRVHSAEDGFLDLRSGPGTGFAIVLEMTNGEVVEILGSSGNWREVRHASGVIGWAHGRYLVP